MTGPAHDTSARDGLVRLRAEVGKAVVGQDAAVTGLLIGLLCRGHVLIEGVPGTAKTLLVRTARGRPGPAPPRASSSPPTSCPATSPAR